MPRNYQASVTFDTRHDSSVEIVRAWPPKNPRYLTEWTDKLITVNIGHKQGAPEPRTWDPSDMWLAVTGGRSSYRRLHRAAAFPRFVETLKLVVNSVCARNHDGDIGVVLPSVIWTVLRIFVWMNRRPASKFAMLSREDVNELAKAVGRDGWWKLLDYDGALRRVIDDAKHNPKTLRLIQGTSKQNTETTLGSVDTQALGNLTGLPFANHMTPRWFVEEVASVAGLACADFGRRDGLALDNQRHTMETLNLLSEIPVGFDRITFFPFANVSESIREFGNRKAVNADKDGRTRNISLDIATSLFGQCIKWVYDYFPGILALVTVARRAVEKHQHEPVWTVKKETLKALTEAYPDVRELYGLPFEEITTINGEHSLVVYLQMFFTAVTCLIATNHGRRRNEVNGTGKPYGLYFGCVQTVSRDLELSRIDIYVEKSLQDYASFWCNKIVTDCVERLEALHQCFRSLNSSPLAYETDVSLARTQKLFSYRYMSLLGMQGDYRSFRWENDSGAFFALLGHPSDVLTNQAHPFRRIFCLLYVYRFDHPELLALSRHLGHMGVDQTTVYAKDPPSRRFERRLSQLMAMAQLEADTFEALLKDIRSDYVLDKIEQMLLGKDIGGGFPRLVLKFVKRLQANIDFQVKSPRDKATALHHRLEKHGYLSIEKEHGACLAGKARHTRRSSNCFRDGELHQEDATPRKCSGCIHHLTTENYANWLEADAEPSRKVASDERVRPSLRKLAASHVDDIEKITAGYRAMGRSNKEAFVAVTRAWAYATEGASEQ